MSDRTRTAGLAVYFYCRAPSRLVWPHQQQGPGAGQDHAAVSPKSRKAVEKRVNLDAPSPAVRDLGKIYSAAGRSKLCTPQTLMSAEAAHPGQLSNYLAQANMRPLLFCCPEPFLSLT